jgi:hypothetical protein
MYSASVGENKKDFDNVKMHGTTMKIKSQIFKQTSLHVETGYNEDSCPSGCCVVSR